MSLVLYNTLTRTKLPFEPLRPDAVTRYVLSRSPAAQRAEIDGAIDRAVEFMPLVLGGRLQDAMTRLHTQP